MNSFISLTGGQLKYFEHLAILANSLLFSRVSELLIADLATPQTGLASNANQGPV